MNDTPRQFLGSQLSRVIVINLMCLVVFVVFCAAMAVGSPSMLLAYWNDHRVASVVGVMLAIVLIPGLVEFSVSRWGSSRR